MAAAGELADIGLFARDVIKFGRKFIELAGLRRAEPRALPGHAHASELRSLEERTGSTAKRCCELFVSRPVVFYMGTPSGTWR